MDLHIFGNSGQIAANGTLKQDGDNNRLFGTCRACRLWRKTWNECIQPCRTWIRWWVLFDIDNGWTLIVTCVWILDFRIMIVPSSFTGTGGISILLYTVCWYVILFNFNSTLRHCACFHKRITIVRVVLYIRQDRHFFVGAGGIGYGQGILSQSLGEEIIHNVFNSGIFPRRKQVVGNVLGSGLHILQTEKDRNKETTSLL